MTYLLEALTTDEVNTKAETAILNFKKLFRMTTFRISEVRLEKKLHCGRVYNALKTKQFLSRGYICFFRNTMRTYWGHTEKDVM